MFEFSRSIIHSWLLWFGPLSRAWLFGTPWTTAYQGPLSMGFLRQAYWSGLIFPSPGTLPDPGIKPMSLALAIRQILYRWATREVHVLRTSPFQICGFTNTFSQSVTYLLLQQCFFVEQNFNFWWNLIYQFFSFGEFSFWCHI